MHSTPRAHEPLQISAPRCPEDRNRYWDGLPKRILLGRLSATLFITIGMQALVVPSMSAATIEGAANPPSIASSQQTPTDAEITWAVEDRLRLEKGAYSNEVDVKTNNGIVTLSGSGHNLLVKERAVKVAESLRGVRGVIDLITVSPTARPDEDIRKDILMALLQDPVTDSFQIAVSLQGGIATLTGSIGTYAEKQIAARIAKGIPGVKELQNNITVNYTGKSTDSEISSVIKDRLQWDIWTNGDMIDVTVKNGHVTISGTAGSAISKSRIENNSWVSGVSAVDVSGVSVDFLKRNEARRSRKYAIRSDREIQQAVQAAFREDPRVNRFSPMVTVENSRVVIRGNVSNLKAKTSAELDARNVVGVWAVDNLLKVRPTTSPTDAEMTKQLSSSLFWDFSLEGANIQGKVVDHVAILSGNVTSSFQKYQAQDDATRIKGVTIVRNNLIIEPGYAEIYNYDWPYYTRAPYVTSGWRAYSPYLNDESIKKSIQNKLYWSPYVDSANINVGVIHGVATLTGTVGSWIGWDEANADGIDGGASSVVNQVVVNRESWLW